MKQQSQSEETTQPTPTVRSEVMTGAGLLAIMVILTIIVAPFPSGASPEALHRASVAEDLLTGNTRGRQGLVGSLNMAPLPTLAVSLVSAAIYVTPSAWVCILIAVASTLFLCLYTNRLWFRAGISPWLRYPAIASLLFFPPVVLSISAGRTTMTFVALVISGAAFWLHWLDQFDLRDLAYAALLIAASVGVRYQGVAVVAVTLLIVLLMAAIRKTRRGIIEGTALTFATPAIFVILLWLGGNWLILGDPLFFLEGAMESIVMGPVPWETALLSSCEWVTVGCIGTLVLSVPIARVCLRAGRGGILVHCLACLGVATAAIWSTSLDWSPPQHAPGSRIDQAVTRLEAQYPNGSFIVTGYGGYEFKEAAGDDPERAWIHMMHLEESKMRRILADFQGRRIFILVKTTPDMDKWQRLGLEWVGPDTRIPDRFLYADSISPWVVFEVLRQSG